MPRKYIILNIQYGNEIMMFIKRDLNAWYVTESKIW